MTYDLDEGDAVAQLSYSKATHPPQGQPDPLSQLRAYWEALREGGSIPFRAQINPRGIESVLSSVFLLERVARGVARFRIAGTHLADLMGMEARGLPLFSLFSPESRAELSAMLEPVLTGPALLTLDLRADRGIGRPALSGRMLLLPLRNDLGRSGLALGALALDGKIGRSPRRFGIAASTLTKLKTPPLAVLPQTARALPKQQAHTSLPQAAGFAELPVGFARLKPAAPHLTLVSSHE